MQYCIWAGPAQVDRGRAGPVDRARAGPSGPGLGRPKWAPGAATTTAAATTEELSTTSRPHPIMRRDPISRSGNPSLRFHTRCNV